MQLFKIHSLLRVITLFVLPLLIAKDSVAQTIPGSSKSGKVLLPNGWSLSPAGRSLPLGDLPLNIQISASQKLMAVTNNGQSKQSIQLIEYSVCFEYSVN